MSGAPIAPQKGTTMSTDDLWITTRITEIKRRNPLVSEAVSVRMGKLINGQLSERPLSPLELAKVADALIEDMIPTPPKADSKGILLNDFFLISHFRD